MRKDVRKTTDIRTCERCGTLFQAYSDRDLCPVCYEIVEEKFQHVKHYIRNNKEAGIPEVSETCGVSEKQILKWVREERLNFSKDSGVGIPCLNCGTPIASGKYCESCKSRMIKDLQSAYLKPETKEEDHVVMNNNRMRFLNRNNDH